MGALALSHRDFLTELCRPISYLALLVVQGAADSHSAFEIIKQWRCAAAIWGPKWGKEARGSLLGCSIEARIGQHRSDPWVCRVTTGLQLLLKMALEIQRMLIG